MPRRSQRASLSHQEVVAIYQRMAPFYGWWARFAEGRAVRLALKVADLSPDDRALEVGAGPGLVMREVAMRLAGGRVVGADISLAMLRKARRRLIGLPGRRWFLVRADARALPFRDEAFDLVVSNYLLDLLPEKDFPGILAQFRRILAPHGRLVLVSMALPRRPWHGFFECLYRLSPRLMGGCRGVALVPYVREAGFVEVRSSYVVQLGFPSEVVWAKKWVGL